MVSIILCGVLIFSGLGLLTATVGGTVFSSSLFSSSIPSSVSLVASGNNQPQIKDYMSMDQAAEYIGVYNYSKFYELVRSGRLDGTYTTYEGEETISGNNETVYIFSKSKLDALMTKRIEEGKGL